MTTPPETTPFHFEAAGDAAVLLVHGFTGTPYEMRGLGQALHAAGLTVRGIRLPGHAAPEEMITASRDDWRRAVRAAYEELRAKYRRVAVGGLSTGALLALDLAAAPGTTPDAVVALAAPMFLYGWKPRLLLPLLARTPLRARMKWIKESPGNIRDPAAQARHPSLRWSHIGAVDELRVLVAEVRRKLPRITAPLLVMHARGDTTALVASADIVFAGVSSASKEKIILTESYHIITVDLERARVEHDVVRFLSRWLAAGEALPER